MAMVRFDPVAEMMPLREVMNRLFEDSVVRPNSETPSSRSSRRTCWLTAGWTMCSRSAARPKCNSSATATKYLS